MKRTIILLLHLGFWIVYFFLILMLMYFLFGEQESTAAIGEEEAAHIVACLAFLPAIFSFYGFYFFLFSRFFRRRKFWQTALFGLLLAAGATALGILILLGLLDPACRAEANRPELWRVLALITGINLFCGLIALVIRSFSSWFDEVAHKEDLLRRNHEMELALVKSQLDPHFLFNTINNIDVLILKDPEEASNYLNRLSDIMRFMLYETKTEYIPLQKEITYIEKYIALQKIRTANEHYVQYKLTGEPTGHTVAPMVFIPFIENAFKHTPNKKARFAIRIHIEISPDAVHLHCSNPFQPASASVGEHGLGNELIRRRLDLLYPAKYQLTTEQSNGRYRVELRIPGF